jgi:uncharacterized protein (TIGR03000 family)
VISSTGRAVSNTVTASNTATELASLDVQVPEQAVVYIGKYRTKSTGSQRRYAYQNLQPGKVVHCQVRAEIAVEGKKIQETKRVELRAGAVSSLVFDFRNIETSLTLRVPADAKVYLGNAEREGTGAVRVFKSKKLAIGEKVTDYPVRVSVSRNGRWIHKEQRISLHSGESKTLSFRFDEGHSLAAIR